jgi:lipopolysaccharide transport system permease protein
MQSVDSREPRADAAEIRVLRIGPSGFFSWPRLEEIWVGRELLFFLTWRDISIRYKQTVLGVAWAVLQPVLTMLLFSLVFGRLAGIPSEGVPYPLFVFCGLLPWQLFAFALGNSANALVANERLVTRVYFPRVLLPVASILAGLVDFAIALVIFALLMLYFGEIPGRAALALPVFVLLALVAALAVGLGLSALNAQFRDVRHALPFLTQFWMFATPIAYPATLFPERWRPLLGLNPMAGVVEGFRWSLLGKESMDPLVWVSGAVTLVVLAVSLAYFAHVERSLADVI